MSSGILNNIYCCFLYIVFLMLKLWIVIILLVYDAYFQRYNNYVVTTRIDTLYHDKFDEFMQAKEEREAEMNKLKHQLINN